MRIGLCAALAVILAGCQTTGQGSQIQVAQQLPPNYRQMIVDNIRSTFFDPYSIRDAMISAPIAGTSLLGPVATVCVMANAKNRMGGYIGSKPTSFVFRDGRLTAQDSDYAGMTCASARYEPFPEIETLGSRSSRG
jgi:hypothetical protein